MTGNAGLEAWRRDPVSAAWLDGGDRYERLEVAASSSMSSPEKEKLKPDMIPWQADNIWKGGKTREINDRFLLVFAWQNSLTANRILDLQRLFINRGSLKRYNQEFTVLRLGK